MRLHLLESLQPRICDLTYLLRLELFPPAPIKHRVKRVNMHYRSHVDKRIAHVATVVEVDWQVQKVIGTGWKFFVNGISQQKLGVLVRDVLDHEGGTVVSQDLRRGHLEMLDLLSGVVAGLNPTENSCALSLLLSCLESLFSLLGLLREDPFEAQLGRVLL